MGGYSSPPGPDLPRLRARRGAPAAPARPRTPTAARLILVDTKAARPRVRFNPAFFRKAMAAHKRGDTRYVVELMREATIDPVVGACLIGRHGGVMQPLVVTAFDDSPTSAERRDELAGVLNRMKPRRVHRRALEARLLGYAVGDPDWVVQGGRQVPTGVTWYDQHYFRYEGDGPDRELRVDHGGRTEEIPGDALVLEAEGQPIMIRVLAAYIRKEFGWEVWSSFQETFGEGFILGKHPKGWTDDQVQALKEGIEELGASGRGVAEEGASLETFFGQAGAGSHRDYKDDNNEEISLALLGHGEAVTRSRGSTQIGDNTTSFKVREEVADDDLYWLDDVWQEIADRYGARNWGDGAYPQVTTRKPHRVNVKEHRENIRLAWDMGFGVHPDDVRRLDVRIADDEDVRRRDPNLLPFD